MSKIRPFVKWAGGKRQIIDKLIKYAPKKFNKYYEPFVGGGAFLFELEPKYAVINDYNIELINVYNCIKDKNKYKKVLKILDDYEIKNSKEFYYEIRNMDRDKSLYNKLSDIEKCARTIYLNKACFNGLYRVNSKNEFNVPFNQKEKVNTYDKDNVELISLYLRNNDITILNGDFEDAVKSAKANDFIYFDPPYDSDTDTFTSYTNNGFNRDDQIRLSEVFKKLDKKGCYVMLSNHNTKLINELYRDYNIHVIMAKRNINSNGKGRGIIEEVIITNY